MQAVHKNIKKYTKQIQVTYETNRIFLIKILKISSKYYTVYAVLVLQYENFSSKKM